MSTACRSAFRLFSRCAYFSFHCHTTPLSLSKLFQKKKNRSTNINGQRKPIPLYSTNFPPQALLPHPLPSLQLNKFGKQVLINRKSEEKKKYQIVYPIISLSYDNGYIYIYILKKKITSYHLVS